MNFRAISNDTRRPRLLASVALLAVLAVTASGCKTLQSTEPPGELAMASAAGPDDEARRASEALAERYRANPNDPAVAINYAQTLRGLGQRSQAVAVLEQASIQHPKSMELLGAYGRALADIGNYQQALDVLSRAHTPDRPDWRILSVQGAVLDQMGRHDDAQRYYATALKIVPDEPSVLSNYGLSYALSKDLVRAEMTLRRAVARSRDPRVRQNLALVVGLQGRFAEAETIARADLPPDDAAANVAYLQQMLAQQNGLQRPATPARPAAAAKRS
jgi:Flp pilus assembly protein TadD